MVPASDALSDTTTDRDKSVQCILAQQMTQNKPWMLSDFRWSVQDVIVGLHVVRVRPLDGSRLLVQGHDLHLDHLMKWRLGLDLKHRNTNLTLQSI